MASQMRRNFAACPALKRAQRMLISRCVKIKIQRTNEWLFLFVKRYTSYCTRATIHYRAKLCITDILPIHTCLLDLKEVNAALKASGNLSTKLTVPNLTKRRGSNH